jgi:SNF2 family DNA or RNA helicase
VEIDPAIEERRLYAAIVDLLRTFSRERSARLVASTLLLEAGSSPEAVVGTLQRVASGDKHSPELRSACAQLLPLARTACTTAKGRALVEIVTAHRQQALVFTRYHNSLAAISSQLAAARVRHVLFHGGLTTDAKRAAVDDFRSGAPVMVATELGGEGQNLQFCSLLVSFDLPWNPMQIEQRIGRLHRMGQKSEVRVFNLCARGTAEQRLLDVLDHRLHLFELVVGEMDMVLGNITDERDLEDRILGLYAESQSNEELDAGFDALASELARAREAYERARAFDEALFRMDYET